MIYPRNIKYLKIAMMDLLTFLIVLELSANPNNYKLVMSGTVLTVKSISWQQRR